MLYGVVDTVLTGHASALDLAAMGLGASVYSTVFVSLLGALNALNPIIAQHHGGRRDLAIGASSVQGLRLASLLGVGGGVLLAFPERWLGWVHAPPAVEALVASYLRAVSLALPASLMFRAIAALHVAVGRPQIVMRLQVAGLVLKYQLSGSTLNRTSAGTTTPLIGGVQTLAMNYYSAWNGATNTGTTTATPASVRLVRVQLVTGTEDQVSASSPAKQRATMESLVRLRNIP
jgi:hypothetical protein